MGDVLQTLPNFRLLKNHSLKNYLSELKEF